ncbi:MAG: DNA repair protein RecN [Bacteroidales bacterium]|nr:DNA repair protein RecN [Bacteroidales bacterium]
MIKSLSITNYALIDELEIDFSKGFSIITGETGAGKSILMGALALITGQRADTGVLKKPDKKCVVEGNFLLDGYGLQSFFEENELDYAHESILRREISPAGKSRAFINDTPVNLNTLKELSFKLIDIHSQHQNLNLNQSEFQLKVVDSYAGNIDLLKEYQFIYTKYKQLKNELNELKNQAKTNKEDFDYLSFLFDELEKAKLIDGELEELEEEAKTLNNTEEIQHNLAIIHNLLNEDEFSVLVKMKEAHQAANRIKNIFNKIEPIEERLDSTFIELKDIAEEVELTLSNIEFSPERIEYVNSRLDLIYSLQKKHNVISIAELIKIKDDLDEKLQNIASFDEQIEKLNENLSKNKIKLQKLAEKLSRRRLKTFPDIEKYVLEQLKHLGMPDAVFKIKQEKLNEFSAIGIDEISFLFSANANIPAQNIGKVASGGEISRLMLSIKSLLSKSISLPTIIFDEIDTGVSGEIADRMAKIMKKMSENMQVISITHLPQVAAKGDTHYLVYKEKTKQTTTTNIHKIEGKQRINELAKMLSGENISKEALENAKVLLGK